MLAPQSVTNKSLIDGAVYSLAFQMSCYKAIFEAAMFTLLVERIEAVIIELKKTVQELEASGSTSTPDQKR